MVISSKIKMMVLGGISLILAGCMDTTSAPVDGSGTATYNHWDVRGRFTTRDDLFQNVTQADLITLLSGKTFVGYEESDGRGGAYGALSVRFFGADGSFPGCIVDYITGKPLDGAYAMKQWISRTSVDSNIGFGFSEFEVIELNGTSSYSIAQYDPLRGAVSFLAFYRAEFRDVRKGHLQNGIPAAVYTACPEFPSAESLGTFVNHNQTSWNYFELVEQDAGDRVIRPDLVTEFTPVPLNPTVAVAQ